MEITARRRGDHWKLQADEKKMLADALDPPLKRVPLPEKELGVIGELGALGFVCFAIFGPRIEIDRAIADARKVQAGKTAPPPAHVAAVVSEAERITADHAERPYDNVTPLDGFRTDMGDGTGVELGEPTGITVGETEPTFIMDADAAARRAGLTPERIVELRAGFGEEGLLLDSYPGVPLDGDGHPLSRGVE